eukprot:scaffold154776_cov36-Tisochrysis_lutea.AAC.2
MGGNAALVHRVWRAAAQYVLWPVEVEVLEEAHLAPVPHVRLGEVVAHVWDGTEFYSIAVDLRDRQVGSVAHQA